MMKFTLIIVHFLVFVNSALAQECWPDSISETTATDRFINQNDGSIKDAKTGLTWSACSVGQIFEGGRCNGSATNFADWKGALEKVVSINSSSELAGITQWRIPNIKELSSLVERRCYNPSINLAVFPDTPSSSYVSSTPVNIEEHNYASRYINFETGAEYSPTAATEMNIRLVVDTDVPLKIVHQ